MASVVYIICDIAIFISVGLTSVLMRMYMKPFERGFFKDDESIMYPFSQSTVTKTVLYSVGFTIPAVTIVITEIVRMQVIKGSTQSVNYIDYTKWIKPSIRINVIFFFGAACTHFLTNISKYSIGRLRPHFFDVCKPDWSKLNNTSGYIVTDICTGSNKHLIKEARLSFMSGHSSMAMYCAIFYIVYLYAKRVAKVIPLLQPFIQIVVFSLAFYTCLSRVSDYKHHWSDVLAGAILGSIMGLIAVSKAVGTQIHRLEKMSSDKGIPNIKMILEAERNPEIISLQFQDNRR